MILRNQKPLDIVIITGMDMDIAIITGTDMDINTIVNPPKKPDLIPVVKKFQINSLTLDSFSGLCLSIDSRVFYP